MSGMLGANLMGQAKGRLPLLFGSPQSTETLLEIYGREGLGRNIQGMGEQSIQRGRVSPRYASNGNYILGGIYDRADSRRQTANGRSGENNNHIGEYNTELGRLDGRISSTSRGLHNARKLQTTKGITYAEQGIYTDFNSLIEGTSVYDAFRQRLIELLVARDEIIQRDRFPEMSELTD